MKLDQNILREQYRQFIYLKDVEIDNVEMLENLIRIVVPFRIDRDHD